MKAYCDELETAIVGSCLCLLSMLGIYAWRNNTGALRNKKDRLVRYGKPGSSDIIGILPDGRFLAVECKTNKGKLSPGQKLFLEEIRNNNGVAIIAHSSDELMDQIKNFIQR